MKAMGLTIEWGRSREDRNERERKAKILSVGFTFRISPVLGVLTVAQQVKDLLLSL